VSPFAQTLDWSVRSAIVPKTARFTRCHCSFYRSALQVPSLLNSSLDPCPRVRLSALADVAKHNYSTGPADAKSTMVLAEARIGQSRTNGARSLRKKSEKMDRRTRLFLLRHAHIDQDARRSMTSNARHARQRSRHDVGFCTGTSKNYSPRSISLNARPSLRKFPFDIPGGSIDVDGGTVETTGTKKSCRHRFRITE